MNEISKLSYVRQVLGKAGTGRVAGARGVRVSLAGQVQFSRRRPWGAPEPAGLTGAGGRGWGGARGRLGGLVGAGRRPMGSG